MTSKLGHLLFLATLFVVASCSQKGSPVKLEVSHNFAFGNSAALQAVSAGGLMVWGKSSEGSAFAQALEGADDLNLSLANGTWTFYAMAWDGTINYTNSAGTAIPWGGVQRCAKSDPVTLNGSLANVQLNINNANCADAVFAGTVPTTTVGPNIFIAPTQFNFCRGIAGIGDASHLCTDSRIDNRQRERKAYIGSFIVNMKTYSVVNGAKTITGSIKGMCTEMQGSQELPTAETTSDASYYGGSSIKVPGLPAGGPGMPFHIEIEMFPGNSQCDDPALGAQGIRGSLVKQFPNGIAVTEPVSHKYFPHIDNTNTIFKHKQYLQITSESICNGRNATGMDFHPFAAGEGTRNNPYIICSVPQFHAINESNTHMSKHFKLEANLDFNPYSNGLAGTGVVPAEFQCLEHGTNFIPVGYHAATCAGPGNPLVYGTLENFTGTFNGGAYTISNLRLRDKDQTNLGLFASINGTTEVGNFNIENVEIEGSDHIGLISGAAQGASSPGSILFWNINAKKVDIQARNDNPATESVVGGFIGRLDNATLFRVSVKNSKVRGENSKVGGLIGYGTYVNLNEVAAEVNIDANSPIYPKYYVGGVVGLAENMQMDYVKHEGALYTNATKTGGIAGAISSASSLTNFYANSHVVTNDNSPSNYLGGVVGSWNGGSAIGPGYTMSIVKSDCTSACTQGPVAGYIASQPGTQGVILTLPPSETGEGASATSFSGETPVSSISDMRNSSNFSTFTSTGAYNWIVVNGEWPRLDFEYHPCTSVINTVNVSGSGLGTAASPKIICNEAQYLNLGSAAAGTYHKLAGNIRLTMAGTSQYDIPNFAAVLDGNNKMILGGYSNASGVSPIGHIGTIAASAIIKNLHISGMGRESNDNTTNISNPHGAFAAINNGKIHNVKFWTDSKYTRFGAGVVGINGSTGELKSLSVEGKLQGYYDSFASIAVVNNGLIQNVKTNSELVCIEGAGCAHFAGLVVQNNSTGTIKRTEMGSRLREQSGCIAIDTSMLVDTNSGLIEDVLVSKYTDFNVSNNANYFHRINSASGVLRRVINNGSLLFNNNNFATPLSGFPTAATAASPGSGTHTDVYRFGGRSGKRILQNVPFNCGNADKVNMSAWGGITDYNNWNSNLLGTGYETNGSKMIVELEFNDGYKTTERILDYDDTTYEFDVPATRCYAGASGKATLWYTDDLALDLTGNETSGARTSKTAHLYVNYSTAFQAAMWDWNTPAHESEKLGYYSYLLGVTSTPVVPRTWELEESGEQRIFELD